MEKIILVSVKLFTQKNEWPLEDLTREMQELIGATGSRVLETVTCLIDEPTPNFSIGKGKVEEIHAYIKEVIDETYGAKSSEKVKILYGGSVKSENAHKIALVKGVSGFLIGGSSLDRKEFAKIVNLLG